MCFDGDDHKKVIGTLRRFQKTTSASVLDDENTDLSSVKKERL
jgi:hypothetical protein